MNPIALFLCLFINTFCVQADFVTPQEFFDRAIVGSSDFIITYQKLGLPDTQWSVREDVVFDASHWPDIPNYLGSRGYEFRYFLHEHSKGYLQEFHTTINVFDGLAPLAPLESRTMLETIYLDYGVFGYVSQASDEANTTRVDFSMSNYQVNVKIKYSTEEIAVPLLIQSAQVILGDLVIK